MIIATKITAPDPLRADVYAYRLNYIPGLNIIIYIHVGSISYSYPHTVYK